MELAINSPLFKKNSSQVYTYCMYMYIICAYYVLYLPYLADAFTTWTYDQLYRIVSCLRTPGLDLPSYANIVHLGPL